MTRWLSVTVSTERFCELRKRWASEDSNRRPEAIHDPKQAKPLDGFLLVLDWETKRVSSTLHAYNPYVSVRLQDSIWLVCDRFITILDDNLKEIDRVESALFNNLHDCAKFNGGLLVCSSGVDRVLYVSSDGKVHTYWNALEQGFALDRFGTRRNLSEIDHSDMYYPTPLHTTHVNSVAVSEDESVILSLFRNGAVAMISTEGTTILANRFSCPHDILGSPAGWSIANTMTGEIAFGRWADKGRSIQIEGCKWLQSYCNFKVGRYIAVDTTASRLIELDEDGAIVDQWAHPPEWKVATVRLFEHSTPD